jgi:Zn-dependent protease
MESSVRLGRIAGIEIGVNWTWVFVFALVVWSLATAVFPDRNPGLSDGDYWAMAAVAAALFFVSILLHELGHAVQARREGIEIEGITLWLFGGVATFKDMHRSSGAELRVALAGPAVSFAIAVVLIATGLVVDLPSGVDGVVAWLGYINALLLVFNLLPALPLDGGRVLHAALWAARDDLVWATRIGAAIGRGFGYFLMGLGILSFVLGNLVGGIWLAFLGWFLAMAAGAEERQVLATEALGDLRVDELMVRDPVTIGPELALDEVMDGVVWRHRHSAYPVVRDGEALGLLPLRCVFELPRDEWPSHHVSDCMLSRNDVPTVGPDEAVVDVLPRLSEDGGARRALVVEGDRLVGLLSLTDVALAIETGGLGGLGAGARRRRAREPTVGSRA